MGAAIQKKSTPCCRMWHFFQDDRSKAQTLFWTHKQVSVTKLIRIYFSPMSSSTEPSGSAQSLARPCVRCRPFSHRVFPMFERFLGRLRGSCTPPPPHFRDFEAERPPTTPQQACGTMHLWDPPT